MAGIRHVNKSLSIEFASEATIRINYGCKVKVYVPVITEYTILN